MSNNKQKSIALLGAMAMMSSQNAYTNAYEGLTDYSDKPYTKSISKTPLSKKQKKSRAKSKAARKARKK